MDIAGQTSIFELDPDLATMEKVWIAAGQGPVRCSVCHRPVHSDEAVGAQVGSHCAARIGRAVMASRNAKAGPEAAQRRNRRALRRARRKQTA